MKKTYAKLIFRGVKGSFARFMSILLIVAVGAGFLSGLLATTPDMQLTVDKYYDEYKLFDIYVKGSLGLTDDDAAALKELDYIETVMPAKVTDVILEAEGNSYVTRVYGVDFSKYGTDEFLNDFEILEGRLPENASECIVAIPNAYSSSHSVGESLVISSENKDYENLGDTYGEDELTIVGIIKHPQYISVNAEPSTVGMGEVTLVAYVPMDFYTLEVYTDIYMTVKNAQELDTFSDEYEDRIETVKDELEIFSVDRAEVRYIELKTDAEIEFAKAESELFNAEKEVNEELGDAWQKIEEAKAELSDVKAEIVSGKTELSGAKQELYDGRIQIQIAKNEYCENSKKIKDAKQEIEQGKTELEVAKEEIEQGKAELEAAKEEIEQGKEQLVLYKVVIVGMETVYAGKETKLDILKQQLANASASTDPNVSATVPYLQEQVNEAKSELEELGSQIGTQKQTYDESVSQLEEAERKCAAAEAELALAEAQIVENEQKMIAAEAEIVKNEALLEEGWRQITENEKKLNDAAALIAENEKKLSDAEQEIAEGESELFDAEQEYLDGKAEAEKEIADAKKELADARKEIDDMANGEWYLFDRGDTVSYMSYKSDSDKVAAIAKVFPMFFFLVAALVALTTMTRMIEEERTQIGTLKAIGYSNSKIKLYYVGYSITASLAGGIIGCIIGFKTLPVIISNAYSMMYNIPRAMTPFVWKYALIVIPVSVLCTTAATISACGSQLKEKPSQLMQQRAPAAGKRILLERIPIIWRRLKFTHKVTARNIFRYKKRLMMTVIGIAGCSALLVAGFGVRDSINDIVDKQYGEIYKYNMMVYLDEGDAIKNDDILREFFADSKYIDSYAEVHSENGYVDYNGKSASADIYVPRDNKKFTEQFVLRERKSGNIIDFGENSVVLTEKLCEKLGISVGETINVRNADGKSKELTVSAIAENYLSSYVFMSSDTYESLFNNEPKYKILLAKLTSQYTSEKDEISKALLESDRILLLQFADTVKVSFEGTVENIDYIVVVLIIAAGLLAMIVLYNLTNINICERKKELATIKVLGFHRKEVAGYIYRETTILSILGTFLGFLLGIWLHKFIVKAAEVDSVMFGREVHWPNFLYAGIMIVIFTMLVDLLMYKKLVKIDMVESMKANE